MKRCKELLWVLAIASVTLVGVQIWRLSAKTPFVEWSIWLEEQQSTDGSQEQHSSFHPWKQQGTMSPQEQQSTAHPWVQQGTIRAQEQQHTFGSGTFSTVECHSNSALQDVYTRARKFQHTCQDQAANSVMEAKANQVILDANTTVDLPSFGVIGAISNCTYSSHNTGIEAERGCQLPPSTECDVDKFSIIMLAHDPSRLIKLKQILVDILQNNKYGNMVEEVILVWNNRIPLSKTNQQFEQSLANIGSGSSSDFRVFHAPGNGLVNNLMNRYHPALKPKSKAILYLDDDGPFQNEEVMRSGFELWKRNSDAQIGFMPRQFDPMTERQKAEKQKLVEEKGPINDREFVSLCRQTVGDRLFYNFAPFPPFGANMVLPSGSFLHRNYLCFLWHPAFKDLISFVRDHPVHPDDMVVATIVNQLSGRSPMTYSRRINTNPAGRRLLWATTPLWRERRTAAANSVISFFGSLGGGSVGWCFKTKYETHGKKSITCNPEMARRGTIPWLQEGGYMHDACPKMP